MDDMLVFLIAYIGFVLVSIPVHELGHLVFGLVTGYRFSSFRLFSFVWYREDGRIAFKNSGRSFMLGQCLMSPPESEKGFRLALYNLGGGLFNLLAALILAAAAVATGGLTPVLIAGITANAVIGLMNLIPLNLQIPNDGYNVLKALQSPDARHAFYAMLAVNDGTMNGKRFRDYDEQAFTVPDSAGLKNYLIAYMRLCEAARLYDNGLYDEAARVYGRLDLKLLPRYYRRSVHIDMIYHYCVHRPDFEKAARLYAGRGMKKYFNMPLPMVTRPLAAYEFFVNRNQGKAFELLQKAKAQADAYPNKGYRLMEKDYIRHLEELMRSSRQ